MARWEITHTENGIRVLHRNLTTGEEFDCGTVHPLTTRGDLLQWIINSAANPGDVVVFPDTVLQLGVERPTLRKRKVLN